MFRSIKYISILIVLSLMTNVCLSLPVAAEDEVSLDQAVEQFYKNNFDVLISKYEIDKAYGDYIGSRLRPNPNLSFNYTFIQLKDFPHAGDNTQTVTRIDQLIELGGKRGLRTGAASETLESSKLSQKDTVRTLLIGFYTVFFNLNTDMLNVDEAREMLERFDKIFAVGEKRYQAGFLTLLDYTKLKLGRIDFENSLAGLETQFRNDTEQFSLLLGSAGPMKPALQVREDFNTYTEQDLLKSAYQYRYDLLSVEKQLKASEFAGQLAKAKAVPDITVGAEFETITARNTPGVGFGVSLPLPLFNRNQGEIARRQAEYSQLELQKDKVKRQIVSDVRQALNNYSGSINIFEAFKTRKNDMKELMSKSEKAFSLGGITVLDLLDTEKTYRDFMVKYNQSLVQVNLNRQLLKVYTGEMK